VRVALVCHHDNPLNREALPRFLAAEAELAGIVVITETGGRVWKRLRFEWRRSRIRMLDVLAFRLFYRLRLSASDREWVAERVRAIQADHPPVHGVRVHETADPNDAGTRAFLQQVKPDLTIARCKTLLTREVFEVPSLGTYVLHPGICPEYRNAHGCFWALARRDLDRVGATLLRIDSGVDTGPVYAYYTTDIDESRESPVVIQHRVVFDNLGAIARDLRRIVAGEAVPIDVTGRESAAWGQPRLTDYVRWKRAARRGT
jgi:folate-dependent phosphoribosylglycinamide formyltransferase PurN